MARQSQTQRRHADALAVRLPVPVSRPLRVYAFDPSRGQNLGNVMTISVPYESLEPGPRGRWLEVIDYDASNDRFYAPVDLEAPEALIDNGLDPTESDPRFHQQMVYAVAAQTIGYFRFALGRDPKWGFGGPRLRIFPHAVQEANAYYSRDLRALVFGYFAASEDEAALGNVLPGQTIFACLSHDIIAHETTHALVDGLRRHFMDPTGPDVAAFHEAFADIVALFQHFAVKDALLDTIQRTGGQLHRLTVAPESAAGPEGPRIQADLGASNPLAELARQFGWAMGQRGALRSALGTPPDSDAIARELEPHARGSILVAAVFDAFFTVYLRRTRDLLRIARASGARLEAGDLHPDLASRLAAEASKLAVHFVNMCVRALDYCPPIDITFGEFLRAVVTADHDIVPDDAHGYRDALIEAFRLRGIRPEGVISLSEDSLRWQGPNGHLVSALPDEALRFNLMLGTDGGDREKIARALSAFGMENAAALGLEPGLPVQAFSFHPVHRIGPDGKLLFDVVAELLQQRPDVPCDPDDDDSPRFTQRGGTTLVIDSHGAVRYAVHKRLDEPKRLARQREFYERRDAAMAAPGYRPSAATEAHRSLDFNLVHRGY